MITQHYKIMQVSKKQMIHMRNKFHNLSLTKKVELLNEDKRWENEIGQYYPNRIRMSNREKRIERKVTKCYNY